MAPLRRNTVGVKHRSTMDLHVQACAGKNIYPVAAIDMDLDNSTDDNNKSTADLMRGIMHDTAPVDAMAEP